MVNKVPSRRRRSPTRAHDPQATRLALLRAGTRAFAEAGYAGAKVERIAALAGVNKAMINYHFRGKRGLHLALLEEAFARLTSEVGPLRAARRPADQALRELVGALGRLLSREPGLAAMLLREMLDGGAHLDEHLLRHMLSVFGATQEIVRRGVRSRRFRRVDPALTHLSVVGPLVFYFATAAFRDKKAAEGRLPAALARAPGGEAFVAHMQELLTRGLLAGGGR